MSELVLNTIDTNGNDQTTIPINPIVPLPSAVIGEIIPTPIISINSNSTSEIPISARNNKNTSVSPVITPYPPIESSTYTSNPTYSTTPLSPPKTTPNLINTPAANPIPNLSSSIPSRLASHHSPPPPIPTSIIINNVPSSSALPIISASVASAAASAAYRSNPMSVSSMVSDHGREELVGAYPAVNNAVTPLPSNLTTLPNLPSTSSSITNASLSSESNGIKPLTNSSGMRTSSIQMIPSFRYPTAQGSNIPGPSVNASGKAREYGSPKVVPMATYGSPKVSSGVLGVLGVEKDKLDGGLTNVGSAPLVATKSERSYPPLPVAFARESPYSKWPSASERDTLVRQQQDQQIYGHNSAPSTTSAAGDLHKSSTASPSAFPSTLPYNRTGPTHRSTASSSSIPHNTSTAPNGSTSAGSAGSGGSGSATGSASGGFNWPAGNTAPPHPGSRDYAYFNDIARSGEQLQQQQQQRERERERDHSHSSSSLPPLPSSKLPATSASGSTATIPTSGRFSTASPLLTSTSRPDPYSNNPLRRYPPTSNNPFGEEPLRPDSTGYTPSRSSAANGSSSRQPVNLPPTTPASTLLSNSSSADRHKRRRSEGNALHDSSSLMGSSGNNSNNLGQMGMGGMSGLLSNSGLPGFTSSTESIRPSKIQKAPPPNLSNVGNHLPPIPIPLPPPPPPPVPVPPPFTVTQQRLAEIRPPCLKIVNEPVLKALEALTSANAALTSASTSTINSNAVNDTRPFLGTSIYDPFVDPVKMLDGEVLRNGIGAYLEVAINVGWMEGWSFEIGDPSLYEGGVIGATTSTSTLSNGNGKGKETASTSTPPINLTSTSTSTITKEQESNLQNRIPATMWDLEPLQSRKVWGTDIYTDDSDILAICLHSGWLRMGPLREEVDGGKRSERTLLVKLVVGPTLLRYQGCTRQGLRSRSWGNGHDGVSLMIEGITLLENRIKPHGRKWIKLAAGQVANSLVTKRISHHSCHSSASSSSAPASLNHTTRPSSVELNISTSSSTTSAVASTSNIKLDIVMAEPPNLDHVRDTFILDPIKTKRVFIS